MTISRNTLTWSGFMALCVFVATCINLSWVQSYHNSDSLLFALISIDHYTPFYWGENRLGQPFSLLASPIRDYTVNLLTQTELIVLASIGCATIFNLFFLHKALSRSGRLAASFSSIILILFILARHPAVVHIFAMGGQPYVQSLFLALSAAALLLRVSNVRSWLRLAGFFALILIEFWLNPSTAPLVFGLVLLLPTCSPDQKWKLRISGLAGVAIAAAANVWFASRYPGPSGALALQSWTEWRFTLQRLWAEAIREFFNPGRFHVFLFLLAAVIIAQVLRRTFRGHYNLADLAVFAGLAVCYAIAIARLEWIKMNLYSPRYWTIPVVLILLLATGWISSVFVRAASNALGSATGAALFAGGALIAIVINVFGFPSTARAKSYLAEAISLYDQDEQRLGCTHFVGDYWAAWASEFQRESSGGPPIYAITMRSEDTRERWDWTPQRSRTYCGLSGDPERELWRQYFKLPPLRETVKSGKICKLEAVRSSGQPAE